MAKIIESNVILTISKLIKNSDASVDIELPDGFIDTMTELAAQLLGDDFVVEFTDIQH